MAETAAVVIPPFITPDPSLWFHMLESTFELATSKPISESKTNFNYVVAHLPPEIATVVRDVIIHPDSMDSYTDLKKKVIERCSESKTQEIRRLLAGESLGDRKPSKLLRVMKRCAESHNIDDSLLLELFIQAMPLAVQTILASISRITLDKAADVSNRILAINPSAISGVSSRSQRNFSHVKECTSDMDLLRDEINKLCKEVNDLCRSRSRIPSYSHPHQECSTSLDNTICWYHLRFREQAKKCIPPCPFKGNSAPEE